MLARNPSISLAGTCEWGGASSLMFLISSIYFYKDGDSPWSLPGMECGKAHLSVGLGNVPSPGTQVI